MSLNEEILKALQEGKTEQEASLIFQQQGYSIKEIEEGLSQVRIKMAVSPVQEGENFQIAQQQSTTNFAPYGQDMQQSVMNDTIPKAAKTPLPPQPTTPEQQDAFTQYQQFQQQYQPPAASQPQDQQPQYYSQDTQQYDSSNADVISEIADQVVSEKLSGLRNSLEAVYNLKNTFETKIASLDERLKKIEKIIDRLQLSVLQKVGEYLTNVDDIKKELIETQQTFKSVMSQNNQKSNNKLS